MKKSGLIFFAIIAMVFLGTSCHKYEDGGYASNLRLCKTWKLASIVTGNVEVIETGNMTITIDKDGTFTTTSVHGNSTTTTDGTWEWTDEKDAVIVTHTYTALGATITNSTTMKILKLTSKELWMQDSEDGITSINKFEKQ